MSQSKDGPKHGTRVFHVWQTFRTAAEVNAIWQARAAERAVGNIKLLPQIGDLTQDELRRRRDALKRFQRENSDH